MTDDSPKNPVQQMVQDIQDYMKGEKSLDELVCGLIAEVCVIEARVTEMELRLAALEEPTDD